MDQTPLETWEGGVLRWEMGDDEEGLALTDERGHGNDLDEDDGSLDDDLGDDGDQGVEADASVPHGNLLSRSDDPVRMYLTQIKMLSYREREVLRLRYGLGDGHCNTLEEVGHVFQVTRERIRQIEAKAVRQLQEPCRSRELAGLLDWG